MQSRNTLLFIALIVAVVSLFSVDMMVGAVNIPLSEVWKALTGGDCPESTVKIVRNIRLVKAFVALLAGAALSVRGLQMQ
ncbi:iron chelate uptake ABC transporter family permease subunit, partial [Duncaniella freteri]|uniref:iron chelate uptake ABC transporter family permease subunit n=1 Tax=Duncaniella freteri TaxID=2530391 RepID=UPI00256EB105